MALSVTTTTATTPTPTTPSMIRLSNGRMPQMLQVDDSAPIVSAAMDDEPCCDDAMEDEDDDDSTASGGKETSTTTQTTFVSQDTCLRSDSPSNLKEITTTTSTTTTTTTSSSVAPILSSSSFGAVTRPRTAITTSPSLSRLSATSPIASILPQKYDPTLEILRSLSSSSMEAITKSHSADPDYDRGSIYRATAGESSSHHQIPRRNLTEAFEELYIKPLQPSSASEETRTTSATTIDPETSHTMDGARSSSTTTSQLLPVTGQQRGNSGKTKATSLISPTGVTELGRVGVEIHSPSAALAADDGHLVTPIIINAKAVESEGEQQEEQLEFQLHPSLQRDLSDSLVLRVSFYAIVHDINKEAVAMAANDDSMYNGNADEVSEDHDALVMAVKGQPEGPSPYAIDKNISNSAAVALIDEEQWLLDAIESRSADETRSVNKVCPPTFLQAMGEREYENPLTILSNGSRTQLWKPSRSWWEAKSGKNPWIEPKSHNKRWRYLWPLIHYHKFLAKCIKKLKRNGVDVKVSLSPVSVFLREEVCAVSDHLAAVSLFDSNEWMDCLQHFCGWTESSKASEEKSRLLISELKLRSIHEPGDIDSPLLRSQIDDHYLRAMIIARTQLNVTGSSEEKRPPKDTMRRHDNTHSNSKQPLLSATSHSRQASTPGHKVRRGLQATPLYAQVQQWQGYPHHGWWQHGWNPHAPFPYPDESSSVHSALSGDSYSHGYMNGFHPHPAVNFQHPYYAPMMYTQHQMMAGAQGGSYDPSIYQQEAYNPGAGWIAQAEMNAQNNPSGDVPGVPGTPAAHQSPRQYDAIQENGPDNAKPTFQTPYKYDPSQVSASPYWNHLQDHATLTMMGLATPQATTAAPSTPHHGGGNSAATLPIEPSEADTKVAADGAQPLLLRQQYYGYSYGAREGYAPPSPATQFLMSPQTSLAYNYGYGFSPRRHAQQTKLANGAISEEDNDARNDVSEASEPATPVRAPTKHRESPDQSAQPQQKALIAE